MLRVLRPALFCLAAVAALALAQEVYRWTDEEGEIHYTNDRSTIPEKFRKKAEPVKGGEVSTLKPSRQRPAPSAEPEVSGADQGASAPAPESDEDRWRREFREAHQRIADLESQIAGLQEQMLKAFRKMKGDEETVGRAKKALAVALTLLDEQIKSAEEREAS